MYGLDYEWDRIRAAGHKIKCYALVKKPDLIAVLNDVVEKLALECEYLPLETHLFPKRVLEENIDIVKRGGFVVIVLDVAGLGKKALELRNFWRVGQTTIGIPFLYLVDKQGLFREFDPLHGYEEIRRFSGRSFEVEAGIRVVVVREDYYRRHI